MQSPIDLIIELTSDFKGVRNKFLDQVVELSKTVKSIVKAEEPMVSYERILLSQIDYCTKVSKEQYPLCVKNLVSLLPVELRVAVINEYDRIMSLLYDYVRGERPHCCEISDNGVSVRCVCGGVDLIDVGNRILFMFMKEHSDLYLKYKHVLGGVVSEILDVSRTGVLKSALMFSIVLDLLLELKIVGPKSITPHIGRVKG